MARSCLLKHLTTVHEARIFRIGCDREAESPARLQHGRVFAQHLTDQFADTTGRLWAYARGPHGDRGSDAPRGRNRCGIERRLVEAVLLFELLDKRRVETAGAAIAGLGTPVCYLNSPVPPHSTSQRCPRNILGPSCRVWNCWNTQHRGCEQHQNVLRQLRCRLV